MGAVRQQELRFALSTVAQTDAVTPQTAGNMISFLKNNPEPGQYTPGFEDDAAEIGKGDEFATQIFATSNSYTNSFDKFNSAEACAIAFAYCLGNSVATSPATGAYRHTAAPIDPTSSVQGVELPYTTIVEAYRQGAGAGNVILDRAAIGVAVNSFQMDLASGPSRASSRLQMGLIGTGQILKPSGITLPAITPVHELRVNVLTINGNDYTSSSNRNRFDSFSFGFNNNATPHYYPGSGFQTANTPSSGQIAGAVEIGIRATTMSFVVRVAAGSTEESLLANQTYGSATINLRGPLITGTTYYDAQIGVTSVGFKGLQLGASGGFVTYQITVSFLKTTGNPLLSCYATNTIPLVGKES